MAKEMIISVNGREKKIAILDNGQVTEFYIERGEENSGVVGNIYKGRVQRVLPGMQSAFVEIGLERDAFLYVSDFFDEEEEIERIMLDKSKKVPAESIEKEVTDQLHRARLEREKQMESVQELAEPLISVKETVEERIEETEEVYEAQAPVEDTYQERRGRSRRNRRGRGGDEAQREELTESKSQIEELQSAETEAPTLETQETYEPIFEIEDSNFERIIDDEETTGEIFKDAYMQEAIVDKVRAIEFDMESTTTAEVGSLLESVSEETSGFERIADEDETPAVVAEPAPAKPAKKRNTNKKMRKGAAEPVVESPAVGEPAVEAIPLEEVATPLVDEIRSEENAAVEAAEGETEKPTKKKKAEPKEKLPRKKQRGGKKLKKGEEITEGEASVTESSDVAEMAVRRGGRRRRGGNGGNRPQGQSDDRSENSDGYEASESSNGDGDSENSRGGYQGGNGGRRDSRRDSRDGRDRSQPTISDLLREGQEIMVQIAKEPIARKGARITSHIALPGRYLVYMPTIEHVGVSRKVESSSERGRLRTAIQKIRNEEDVPSGGFIVRTAGIGVPEENLRDDARYLVRTWRDIKKQADKSKSPALVHQDLDLIQRLLRDQLSDDFSAIRVDSEEEYLRIVEFINRIQPKMVNRVKLYTRDTPILENYGVQEEIDKALKPRVWLKSGGYLVINQTEALVSIDVNTGKFVGKGNARLEDTITKTNMEAVEEIARQIRLRDLGGIIVLDLIDMEDRRNRHKVMGALQDALSTDKSPTKVLSFNDFGLVIMTRKRVKQSLERTMCSPCSYCQGAGLVKSAQTVCYEILEESRHLSKGMDDVRQTTLRVNPEVAKALRGEERSVLEEIEAYLGTVDLTSDASVHQEQFDFAFI